MKLSIFTSAALASLAALSGSGCQPPQPHPTHPNEIVCTFAATTRCSATFSSQPNPTRDMPCVGALQTWNHTAFVERHACVTPTTSRSDAYNMCVAHFARDTTGFTCDPLPDGLSSDQICGTENRTTDLAALSDVPDPADPSASPLHIWGPNECDTTTMLPLLGT